jgi:erythromycin esterase-like protein
MSDPRALRQLLEPLSPALSQESDVDRIVEKIGDARIVLLGEASHGTHEFYALRAAITRALIERKGFRAVTIEGDWPDARRVDRFVKGTGSDSAANQALSGFRRFPQWMWRNTVVEEFVTWLNAFNHQKPSEAKCGFYGLDLYSLHASIQSVLLYLAKVDPAEAARARERYSCLDMTSDPQEYGYAAAMDAIPGCEDEVVRQLTELRSFEDKYTAADGHDEFFSAEQNARLVANAEQYYRSMFRGRASSWNLRDTHMVETLEAVSDYLERDGDARLVVWAHNSHLGDARATQMGRGGEINVGQLVREQFGNECFNVGFTTYRGSVSAARDWDAVVERRMVRPGLSGSVEALFHSLGVANFLLDLRQDGARSAVGDSLIERAIGVIYRPETERMSHYFTVDLAKQFDLVIHIDETRALEPLEPTPDWHAGEHELAETYPSAL